MDKGIGKYFNRMRLWFTGYTMIELVTVMAIVLIITLMAASAVGSSRRYAIEEKTVIKLRQLADIQERYRFSSDPSVNPDGSYGTFEELQLAGYVPDDFSEDDVRAHTVNAFMPYYRLDIVRSPNEPLDEPDGNSYYIRAYPVPSRMKLRTYHMLEDGEVWHTYGLRYFER